jgi:two-component system cell cycle sensor histidine kinase/response regulator CckA
MPIAALTASARMWRRPFPYIAIAAGAGFAGLLFAYWASLTPQAMDLWVAAGAAALLALLSALGALITVMVGAQNTAAERALLERAFRVDLQAHAIVGPDGKARHVSAAFTRRFGVNGDDAPVAAAVRRYISRDSESAARFDQLLDESVGREPATGEIRLPSDGDAEQWISLSICPLSEPAGHALWRVEDIAARRQMQDRIDAQITQHEALEALATRFQRLFDDAPGAMAVLDPKGTITECNQTFLTMTGHARDDIVDRPFPELIAAEGRAEIAGCLAKVASDDPVGMPVEVELASGEGTVAALYASRAEDAAGDTSALVLHLVDTTDQKKLEVQFAQSQKMLAVGQLAGGVAHDFNNLLTAMIGFCDLLLLRHRAGDPSFPDIMQVKQNANRAANLVRQLLAFSRQQTLQPRVLNLTDVLADLSNLVRRLIGANIELNMVHGRDLGLVKADPGQIEQVIINLAVNARDAMPRGGTVTVRTENIAVEGPPRADREGLVNGNYVLIEVIDTGDGIPQDIMDRIFDPFFSTKGVGEGTGLGLSTVYGIVKQTGGYVFVDSTPDAGTRFSIYLPIFEGVAEAGGTEDGAGDGVGADLTGAGTVLLVEDEDPVRLFSARALRTKGYKVLEAKTGDAALEMLTADQEPVDLLITDVVMPRMDGPALIGAARDHRPELKVICMSGYAEDSFRQKLEELSDIHFLPKPFSLEQLAGKVKEVIRVVY